MPSLKRRAGCPGRSRTLRKEPLLPPAHLWAWAALRGGNNCRKLASAAGKTEFQWFFATSGAVQSMDPSVLAGAFSPQGSPLRNRFPKAIRQQESLIIAKQRCRIVLSLSPYKWCSALIALLLYYHHTKLESRGNHHHPKALSRSEFWSWKAEEPWESPRALPSLFLWTKMTDNNQYN